MSSTTEHSFEVPLASLFHTCLNLFGNCLLALEKDNCRPTKLQQVDVSKVIEEYGRLRVWGEQTKATLPQNARYSLDETLRGDFEIISVVSNSLRRLSEHLKQALAQAEQTYEESQDLDEESSSDGDESTSSSGTDDSAEDTSHPARRSVIARALRRIFQEIQTLYRISSLLHRPRNTNKYLRSSQKSGSPADSPVSRFEYEHISEKIRQWRGQSKCQHPIEEDESAATEEHIRTRRESADDECKDARFLCERLSRANVRRREQLHYWTKSPDASATNQIETLPSRAPESSRLRLSTESPSQPLPATFSGQKDHTKRPVARSTTTNHTFSSVAISALDETKTQTGRAKTLYAQSVAGVKRSNRVPDVPKKSKEQRSFECPFCHMELDSARMQNRLAWKRHTFRDLRPYVCTFERCQTPDKHFVTRHDWIYHEQQMHRRQWLCPERCGEKSFSKVLMVEHLENSHPEDWSQSQSSILVDMCEGPIDDMEPSSCPLCLEDMPLSRLRPHLAEHLEDLALFVLPSNSDDNDGACSSKGVGSKTHAASKSKDSTSNSSLGFSDPRPYNTLPYTSRDFANLLTMEETGPFDKVATWDHQEAPTGIAEEEGATAEKENVAREEAQRFAEKAAFQKEREETKKRQRTEKAERERQRRARVEEDAARVAAEKAAKAAEADKATEKKSTRSGSGVSQEEDVDDTANTLAKSVTEKSAEKLGETDLNMHKSSQRFSAPDRLPKVHDANQVSATSLYEASLNGLVNSVDVLIEKGANVNAHSGTYGNALQAASLEGREEVVRLLLERGANINAQGGVFGNALQAASYGGHQEVVRLLLKHGAAVNAAGGYYGNALQAACYTGREEIVRLLIEHGADVNAKGGYYQNPCVEDSYYDKSNALQAASAEGHQEVVRLLIERGAEINAQCGHYGNALQAASFRGHQDLVRLLLERGADVDAKGGKYGNASLAAHVAGHEKIVQLLLYHDAHYADEPPKEHQPHAVGPN